MKKKHAYLCRWRLLHESLWWGRGLENLLGDRRCRAREPRGGELLACRGDDVAGLLGWLGHEGWGVDRAGWGLRSLSWGLPTQVHLAELCCHIISLQDTKIKEEISEICLVMGEAHRGTQRPHDCHCVRSREYDLEKIKGRDSPARTRERRFNHPEDQRWQTVWPKSSSFDGIKLLLFH